MDDIEAHKECIKLTFSLHTEDYANIGRKLISEHPGLFLELYGTPLNSNIDILIVSEIYKGIRDSEGMFLTPPALNIHNLVAAIRYYRNCTKSSLRESKTAVELIVGHKPPTQD